MEDDHVNNTNTTKGSLHEINSPEAIAEATTLVIIMIASFFANVLAMTQIMTSTKQRRNHHNLLIANLNVIDLGITFFSMTFSVAAIFDDGQLLKDNQTICTINGFFAITCSIGNFTNVMCIAVDRYLSIVWSTRFPPTRRRAYFLIAFVWIVSVTATLPPTFQFWSSFKYTAQTHHCSPAWDICGYYYVWFTIIFGVTVPVMIFCYACIIYYIRKSDRQLNFYDGIKSRSNVSKATMSASKDAASSRQSSPNLSSCTFRNAGQGRLPPSVLSLQLDNSYGEKQQNRGYQNDDLDLKEIKLKENTGRKKASGPFVISGHVLGDKTKDQIDETAQACQEVSQSTDQQGSCCIESMPVDGGQRGQTTSSEVSLDVALNKLTARKRKLSVEKRVALTGAMLILTTIICWAPYCIIHFCGFPDVSHSVAAATMWIAYANSLLDPLVYVFMNRKEHTVQHLSRVLTTCWKLPRRFCARLRGKQMYD